MYRPLSAGLLSVFVAAGINASGQISMDKNHYDVVWDSPSKDASGSMPIGNGEVVLNVWVEATTGDLLFYIARTDSLSEISRILKLGRVRVHLKSGAFLNSGFQQHLYTHEGRLEILTGTGRLSLFVDADSDTIFVKGDLEQPDSVEVTNESWRTEPHSLHGEENSSAWSAQGGPFPMTESADVFYRVGERSIGWYHRNETSTVPTLLQNQSLTGLRGVHDPLLHRTFGGCITGEGFAPTTDRTLSTTKPTKSFTVKISAGSRQVEDLESWKSSLRSMAEGASYSKAIERTKKFWQGFWNRSWFECSNETIGRGYNLQRYVQACQGRGTYPIKFNGGYFTVEPKAMGKEFNPDWRAWGDSYWYQNVRHMEHPMLASGDFEMMDPFFKLYESNRVLAESRSELYYRAKGAYFPETMSVFGTYAGGDYGWKRDGLPPGDVQSPWWRYAWNQGLELVALMLDRWDYTRDEKFARERLVPMSESVLRYFDTRFKRDPSGKIILDPTQSVETYWTGVVNDMPSTAGLIAVTHRLVDLPKKLKSAEQESFFIKMKSACPDLPFQEKDGRRELSPAQKFDRNTSNVENPELYAVWPFRVVCLQRPELLNEAIVAYKNRLFHQDVGWGYDGNAAALLGLTDESARILLKKCTNSNPAYRWPASWGPNFDWIPDQNHGGNLLETANLMLIQGESLESGGKILLLPTWPKSWDVAFKLHAPGMTTVECETRGGKIVKLDVSPKSRMKDVVAPAGWEKG